jgi:hypothetical protein
MPLWGNWWCTISSTRFEKVTVGLNADTGELQRKIQEVFKETTVAEFISYLKLNLQKFP